MILHETDSIRVATLADSLQLNQLSLGLGYAGGSEQQAHQRLEAVLASASDRVWVMADGAALRGWIHGFIAHRVASPGFIEIGGLVVDPGYHRRGIATQLLAVVRYWAESQGLPLRVRCHSERLAAQQFYRSQGLEPLKQQIVFACN